MLKDYPEVLTVSEIKQILYIGKNKAYEMLQSGELKGFRIGKNWRMTRDDMANFLKNDVICR